MKSIFKYKIAAITSILFIGLLGGCQKEWDAPEFQVPHYTGPEPNKTIQDIKNKHLVLDAYVLDSICAYNETFIVDGIVTSTDEGGNFYKTITIQDETGGITIQLDNSGLFNSYPLGQRVIIDCRGLIVGDYNRLYQIGWEYQKYSVGRINAIKFDNYIHKDGLPSLENLPEPVLGNQIDFNSLNDVGKIVKLENCQFNQESWGKPLSYNEYVTEHTVMVSGISTPIIVRTSNYARFRSVKVPSTVGTLYGILTVYNDSYQLMLRTKSDIQFEGLDDPSEEILEEYIFDQNSIGTGGWSALPTTSSTKWSFINWAGDQYMYHNYNTTNVAMNDWLVSPTITLASTNDTYVRLLHKITLTSIPDYYQIYYTTNVDAPFDEANYLPLPSLTMFPSEFGNSNDISLAGISSNSFKIALRYNNDGGTPSSAWYIKNLSIIKK